MLPNISDMDSVVQVCTNNCDRFICDPCQDSIGETCVQEAAGLITYLSSEGYECEIYLCSQCMQHPLVVLAMLKGGG